MYLQIYILCLYIYIYIYIKTYRGVPGGDHDELVIDDNGLTLLGEPRVNP